MNNRTLPTSESRLTQGPVLPVLLSLSAPNMLAMAAIAAVSIAETSYVALLGREPLAAIAIAFPLVTLMQNLSAGAIGGGISSAISQALGAGDDRDAATLAFHAVAIALIAGLLFAIAFSIAGPMLYALLGAQGAVMDEVVRYGHTFFLGAIPIWIANAFIAILRGTGNMFLPSVSIVAIAVLQICVGAVLSLGLGPAPRLGMIGVALGQVLAFAAAALWLGAHLCSSKARVRLTHAALRPAAFHRILRVGLVACLSPVQTVLTVVIVTALVSRLGVNALAGYGIGARLEFLLIPIAFGVGVGTVPMVGMAVGRGDLQRARRVAWTAAAVSAALVGAIGLVACIWPTWWPRLFTSQPEVLRFAAEYLRYAGPGYAFFGLGLTLFFASQGAGKVLGPVLAGTLRLVLVTLGGVLLLNAQAPSWTFFALVSLSMVAYGLCCALAVLRADWRRA